MEPSSTCLLMASQRNLLAITLSILALSSRFYLTNCNPGPAERIFDPSTIQNLNDKSGCVAAIALVVAVPSGCSKTGSYYVQECTAAVIGRKTLLSNANCIKNLMELAEIFYKRFNIIYPFRYPVVILGAKNLAGMDVDAPGVFKITFQESMLEYHPDYNGSSHDLVAIKLETAIPTSVCPQPFSLPSKTQNELTYAGPFMLSWGQPVCTGNELANQTYSMAKNTKTCSNAVDGFAKTDDQMCVNLKSVQANTVEPRAAQGDQGSPIYVAVSSGENGNVAKYVLTGILGIFPKSDPLLYPDPNGQGCSKTSVVPAINLLESRNMAFLIGLAAQQKDILKSPIPDQIPLNFI